jgi:hypothetical protein
MSLKNTIIGLDDITEIFNRLPVHHKPTHEHFFVNIRIENKIQTDGRCLRS